MVKKASTTKRKSRPAAKAKQSGRQLQKTSVPPDYRNASADLVAEVFGVTRQAVHKWRREDGAPSHQVGKDLRFDCAALLQWKVDRAVAVSNGRPRAATDEPGRDRDAVLAQVQAILEQGDSDVARMQAAKLMLSEADRDRLEEQSRDSVIAFIEIANDGDDRIVTQGPTRVKCPRCGELIEAE